MSSMVDIPGYFVKKVDGLYVPVQHLDLYKVIVSRYGPLFVVPIPITKLVPEVLLTAVTKKTLDVIAEMVSVKHTGLMSREHLNAWLAMSKFANSFCMSVGWLSSLVEELDRIIRTSQSEALEDVASKLQLVLAGFVFKLSMSSMGKDNVQMRLAEIPGYTLEDEFPVPVEHLDLYKKIVSRYGPLISGPIDSLPIMRLSPRLLLAAITKTMDVIAEIDSVKHTGLISRKHLNNWLEVLKCANSIDLSVGWLSFVVEELDRIFRTTRSEAFEDAVSKLQLVLAGFL